MHVNVAVMRCEKATTHNTRSSDAHDLICHRADCTVLMSMCGVGVGVGIGVGVGVGGVGVLCQCRLSDLESKAIAKEEENCSAVVLASAGNSGFFNQLFCYSTTDILNGSGQALLTN